MTASSPADYIPLGHEGCRVVGCACGNLAREKAAEQASQVAPSPADRIAEDDQIAWIRRRLEATVARDVEDVDAECARLQTARLDVTVWAVVDLEHLLSVNDRLTARVEELQAQLDAKQRELDKTVNQLHMSNASALRELQADERAEDLQAKLNAYAARHQPKTVHGDIVICESCLISENSLFGKTYAVWPCDDAKAMGLDGGPSNGS